MGFMIETFSSINLLHNYSTCSGWASALNIIFMIYRTLVSCFLFFSIYAISLLFLILLINVHRLVKIFITSIIMMLSNSLYKFNVPESSTGGPRVMMVTTYDVSWI